MGMAVIAQCHSPPVLDFSEGVFDFMSLFVEGFVVRTLGFAVSTGWDTGHDADMA